MLTLCSFLMVRHTHQWKICQKQPSQFLVFSELCANWSLCICEVFMITSELADSHRCQIYGRSVKYLKQICLPELIHLKKTNHTLLKCQGLCHVISSVQKKTEYYQKEICYQSGGLIYRSVWIIDSHCSLFFTFLIIGWYTLTMHGSIKSSQSYSSEFNIKIQIGKFPKHSRVWNSIIFMQYIVWNLPCTKTIGKFLYVFHRQTLSFSAAVQNNFTASITELSPTVRDQMGEDRKRKRFGRRTRYRKLWRGTAVEKADWIKNWQRENHMWKNWSVFQITSPKQTCI